MDYTLNFKIVREEPSENDPVQREDIVNFLYKHLEQYGDVKEAINNSLDYAFSDKEGMGGFVVVGQYEGDIAGVVVINETGMRGYIPENILVYIAVDAKHRGKGFGKQMMIKTIEQCEGDIALHVEADNPAKYLYEKVGFTNPYLEMRLKRH